MSGDPGSLQLRFLQTVSEIAAENNSTTLFPIPMDLFKPFMRAASALPAEAYEEEEEEEVEEEAKELPAPDPLPGRLASGEPVPAEKREE